MGKDDKKVDEKNVEKETVNVSNPTGSTTGDDNNFSLMILRALIFLCSIIIIAAYSAIVKVIFEESAESYRQVFKNLKQRVIMIISDDAGLVKVIRESFTCSLWPLRNILAHIPHR